MRERVEVAVLVICLALLGLGAGIYLAVGDMGVL